MCFWSSSNKAERVYLIMFVLGAGVLILSFFWGVFTLDRFLSGFPIAAVLASSYFWIRLDVWRSDKTIDELCNSSNGSNESLKAVLISQRCDSRAALFLLTIAAVAQAFFLMLTQTKAHFIFIGSLLVLTPLTNCAIRLVQKNQLKK